MGVNIDFGCMQKNPGVFPSSYHPSSEYFRYRRSDGIVWLLVIYMHSDSYITNSTLPWWWRDQIAVHWETRRWFESVRAKPSSIGTSITPYPVTYSRGCRLLLSIRIYNTYIGLPYSRIQRLWSPRQSALYFCHGNQFFTTSSTGGYGGFSSIHQIFDTLPPWQPLPVPGSKGWILKYWASSFSAMQIRLPWHLHSLWSDGGFAALLCSSFHHRHHLVTTIRMDMIITVNSGSTIRC